MTFKIGEIAKFYGEYVLIQDISDHFIRLMYLDRDFIVTWVPSYTNYLVELTNLEKELF